jgi:hypothetical protein
VSPRPDAAVSGTSRRQGASAGSCLWLISKPHSPGLPTPWLVEGGRGLPVFSFREEAEVFLRSRGFSSVGWKVREAGAEELLAVLLGPACAVTKKVLLDPILGVADRVSSCLVGIGKERFVGRLLEQFRAGRTVRTTG